MAGSVEYKAILSPEQVLELIIKPLERTAVAAEAADVVHITSNKARFPIITADPSAEWVPEGGKIPISNGTATELAVEPKKLAVLSTITNELRDDSSPAATDAIGAGLLRDAAKKLDMAWLSAPVVNGPEVTLASVTGINTIPVTGALSSLDPFVDAAAAIEDHGSVSDWIMSKSDVVRLSKLRKSTGSNEGLLSVDPTQPSRRMIEGARIHISPYATEGTIYGLDKTQVKTIIREDATVETSDQFLFDSDSTALRLILRAGFAFPNPGAVSKIVVSA